MCVRGRCACTRRHQPRGLSRRILARHRYHLSDILFRSRYSFLTTRYVRRYYWFELMIMLRKFLIIVSFVLFTTNVLYQVRRAPCAWRCCDMTMQRLQTLFGMSMLFAMLLVRRGRM